MAKQILINYDFCGLESFRFRFQNLASSPAGTEGSAYMNTVSHKWMFHNGTTYVDPTDRSQHTGTQIASSISDLPAVTRANRLDQFAAPNVAVSFAGFKIINLADGTAATDAVNYGQLQAVANGRSFKDAVRCATTANLAALSGLLTIDGITVVAGDRVLVKNQTAGAANGIYVAASGAWARSPDANTSALVTAGMSVMVTEGTTQEDRQFTLTTNNPIVLNTTVLVFALTGSGSSYTQGTGILISGSVISIDPAVTSRKAAGTIGDGTATSIAVTHNLATLDVVVNVVEVSTGATVECDVVRNTTNQVTLSFIVAPTSNQYRVVVQG